MPKKKIIQGIVPVPSLENKLLAFIVENAGGAANLFSDIENNLKSYAQQWAHQSAIIEKEGTYKKLSEFCSFKEGDLWVDLGSGCGNLIEEAVKSAHLTVIGVDMNDEVLKAAAEKLSKIIDVNACLNYELMQGDTGWKKLPKAHKNFKMQDNSANLIVDNIESLEVLKQALAGRKADKITYIHPGGFQHNLYEFAAGYDQFEFAYRCGHAVISAGSQILRKGGELILGIRVKIPSEVEDKDSFIDSNISMFGHPLSKVPGFEKKGSAYASCREEVECKPLRFTYGDNEPIDMEKYSPELCMVKLAKL